VLEQGKYHQVKRMLAAADNHCVALHRAQIGGLKLEALGLAEGMVLPRRDAPGAAGAGTQYFVDGL